MVVTIVCRDTINCKVTIVLCNGALIYMFRKGKSERVFAVKYLIHRSNIYKHFFSVFLKWFCMDSLVRQFNCFFHSCKGCAKYRQFPPH